MAKQEKAIQVRMTNELHARVVQVLSARGTNLATEVRTFLEALVEIPPGEPWRLEYRSGGDVKADEVESIVDDKIDKRAKELQEKFEKALDALGAKFDTQVSSLTEIIRDLVRNQGASGKGDA